MLLYKDKPRKPNKQPEQEDSSLKKNAKRGSKRKAKKTAKSEELGLLSKKSRVAPKSRPTKMTGHGNNGIPVFIGRH